ncbi:MULTISPECIES: DUF3347 domain-containing protein [Arenibacter]|uniref:DUF3347 domain-containing protein n=1 Tax=Arenibacter TaxID=178469 RepID=UPI001C074477|nr:MULTISPECIES: DUF3347 domain-containing protein [Arenibacter]MBU2907312.1 DUF3347 domain-containing protein [Arenibacter algicola]MCK0133566.1 DUF3347 domain-containing protein [Arenibacter sp. S6351L]
MKRNVNITLTIAAISIISLSSCKDENKKESTAPISNEINQETATAQGNTENIAQDEKAIAVVNGYLSLKDALVADDTDAAVNTSKKLLVALENFDITAYSDTEQSELQDIIEEAMEHAEQIAESPIDLQREHFKVLSKDVTEMVAITGTNTKLYEQFCPMYDKGTAWLSTSKEIKNPYYGSKMLACGKVQKEIN